MYFIVPVGRKFNLISGLTWLMVYRTEKYQKLKAEVERQSKKCKSAECNLHKAEYNICVVCSMNMKYFNALCCSSLCVYEAGYAICRNENVVILLGLSNQMLRRFLKWVMTQVPTDIGQCQHMPKRMCCTFI